MIHVYILWSDRDGGFYVGMSNDVARRVREHNAGLQRSTKARLPFRILLVEDFSSRPEARIREKYWKSGKGGEELRMLVGHTRLRRAGAAE